MARKRDLKIQRFWIGIIVLTVILVLGILLTLLFSHIHHPLAQQLREAAAAGVQVLAMDCRVTEDTMTIQDSVEVKL